MTIMENKDTNERVTQAFLKAITSVITEFHLEGDAEALNKIGPTLLTAGIMVLTKDIGRDGAARVVAELAPRIQRGDFDGALEGLVRVEH